MTRIGIGCVVCGRCAKRTHCPTRAFACSRWLTPHLRKTSAAFPVLPSPFGRRARALTSQRIPGTVLCGNPQPGAACASSICCTRRRRKRSIAYSVRSYQETLFRDNSWAPRRERGAPVVCILVASFTSASPTERHRVRAIAKHGRRRERHVDCQREKHDRNQLFHNGFSPFRPRLTPRLFGLQQNARPPARRCSCLRGCAEIRDRRRDRHLECTADRSTY